MVSAALSAGARWAAAWTGAAAESRSRRIGMGMRIGGVDRGWRGSKREGGGGWGGEGGNGRGVESVALPTPSSSCKPKGSALRLLLGRSLGARGLFGTGG